MGMGIKVSVNITSEITVHLCLTLTPRMPGYPTGPWMPSKPYIKNIMDSKRFILILNSRKKKHEQAEISNAPSDCVSSFKVVQNAKDSDECMA